MKEFWTDSKTFAARAFHISLAIMEMHSPKFVSLAIFYVCVWRVSVINVVLLLVTVVTLPWPLVRPVVLFSRIIKLYIIFCSSGVSSKNESLKQLF